MEMTCASCGSALQGKFCHACGEKQLDPHQSPADNLLDDLGSVISSKT